MFTDFTTFILFVLVTSITPGPNNISSLSFCLKQGYRRTLPYLLGIISGNYCVMLTSATTLYLFNASPIASLFAWMKYVGAAYILYLAYKTYRMNVNWQGDTEVRASYWDGLLLQFVNPKAYFFALTIFTTFINYKQVSYWQLPLLCLLLCSVTFTAITIWGEAGSLLKRVLQNPRYIRLFGILMALALLYTAYTVLTYGACQ